MAVAIKVENLSKAYQLGEFSTGTMSRDIERWFDKVRGKGDRYLRIDETSKPAIPGDGDMVWSLRNINFQVEEGTAVGIIGRNGAGKSTLLKILSRVTSPTSGTAKVRGRIASLLEVGTGFHPELTGRENTFLNGAILGMRKAEIRKHFDAIVDFSGVERYIDTPVKRYSSGMFVRLAFAVAAHLESEILIVDEVLAVGDYEFQKKCLGKMGEVSKGKGKTVLFVSHNMASIQALCNKGILLDKGITLFNGNVDAAILEYTSSYTNNKTGVFTGNGLIRQVRIIHDTPMLRYNSDFQVEVEFRTGVAIKNLVVGIVIKDELDVPIVGVNNRNYVDEKLHETDLFNGVMNVVFRPLTILPGTYKLDIYLGDSTVDLEVVHDALSFEVEETRINSANHPLDLRVNKVFIRDVNWQLKHI